MVLVVVVMSSRNIYLFFFFVVNKENSVDCVKSLERVVVIYMKNSMERYGE